MSVTDLLGKDAGLTVLTVLHSPGGSSNCHAVQLTERASDGQAAALSLTSYNSSAGALQIRSTGPYLQAYDGSNALKFELANSGAMTVTSLAATSLTTTGAVSVGTTLAVTGASTLTGNTTVGGTLGVTGASTLASAAVTGNATVGGTLGVTGATTMSTASTSGAATLNSAVVTTSATVGTTLGVTGATTLSSTLAVTGTALFTGAVTVDDANFSVLGVNKGYRFRPLGARLDCEATGSDWMFSVFSGTNFDGTQRTYLRLESGARIAHACGTWTFTDTADSAAIHTLDGTNNTLGFHGSTAVAKQTVTGAKGGNAALTDLITKLATLGLITDGTS